MIKFQFLLVKMVIRVLLEKLNSRRIYVTQPDGGHDGEVRVVKSRLGRGVVAVETELDQQFSISLLSQWWFRVADPVDRVHPTVVATDEYTGGDGVARRHD